MLGEQIAVEKIKMVSRRVLSVEGGVPKIETSTTGTGNNRGTEYQQTSTFWAVPKSLDGKTMYIEGQGRVSMDHCSTKLPVVANCLHYQIL